MFWLHALNFLFFAAHSLIIVLNVAGWAWKKTRLAGLIMLTLTAFSWGVMGIWKGAGYCVCTDLHWRVREAMGIQETSSSYLVLLVKSVTGWSPPLDLTNTIALVVFLFSLGMSVGLNTRDWRQKNSIPSTILAP